MASTGNHRTALITGASSGIGYEFARLFARDHFDLVLVARSGDRLSSIADQLSADFGVSVRPIARDLGRPGAAEDLFGDVDGAGTTVDVLVNNAGFGLKGAVAELSAEAQEEMVQLNVLTLTGLTRRFLTGMLERRQGGILK